MIFVLHIIRLLDFAPCYGKFVSFLLIHFHDNTIVQSEFINKLSIYGKVVSGVGKDLKTMERWDPEDWPKYFKYIFYFKYQSFSDMNF